eukprot:TRINITY_DN124_c0_g1_i4.p1 TRINITY_DN124_c0_g1~~TRINITY_DN124_c0_g1_i4.p1  ORF type:complete len:248 (-),score=81.51 TRINITY_DN124_c0_g1_i4:1037-1780(-)
MGSHFVDNAVTAAVYSCMCSSGFLVSVLLAWVLLALLSHGREGGRPPGNFGLFMVALEALDAIPEAAVIAESVAAGSVSWSFVLSIFFLNTANSLATSLDIMATRSTPSIHRLLYMAIFMSIGMLSYSISTTVYANFAKLHSLWLSIAMLLGTLLGAVLILLLMKLEDVVHDVLAGDAASLQSLPLSSTSRLYRSIDRRRQKKQHAMPDLKMVAQKLRLHMEMQQEILACPISLLLLLCFFSFFLLG